MDMSVGSDIPQPAPAMQPQTLATRLAAHIDAFLRDQDFAWNRITDGRLNRPWRVERHTLFGVLMAVALIFFIWCGPVIAPGARLWAGIGSLLSMLLLLSLMRLTQRRGWSIAMDLLIQLALIGLSSLAVVRIGDERPGPAGHVYVSIVLFGASVFGVSTLVAIYMARWAYRSRPVLAAFAPALNTCELFAGPRLPDPVTKSELWRGLLNLPQRLPHLLLLPAIFVLLAPGTMTFSIRNCVWIGAVILALNLALLVLGEASHGLNSMITLIEAPFLRGTSAIVSVLVIALAFFRIIDLDYISTLLDSPHTLAAVLSFLILGYTISWWYDYWTGRLVSDQLLRLLGKADRHSAVAYSIEKASATSGVPIDGRFIELQGANRFVIVQRQPVDGPVLHFQTLGTFEIFRKLAPTNAGCRDAIEQLMQRHRPYATVVTLLPLLIFSVTAYWLHGDIQLPEATIAANTATTLTPAALLTAPDVCTPGGRVIAIAASGGGTRAAVFTSAVLEGLRAKNLLPDVRLVSGVSGGGAALAYFASHRDQLLEGSPSSWSAYFEAMTSPFIADVLEGLGEWRVMHGTRLGRLLDESFTDRWNLTDDRNHPARVLLGDVHDIGLLLNTSIAGRFEPCDKKDKCGDMVEVERNLRKRFTRAATGRLVLTNLAIDKPFDTVIGDAVGSDKASYVIANDPGMRLTTAAALNANFPPVFSNAAVDMPNYVRYWVTDGGALDNSGLESLLYVLRQVVTSQAWTACASHPRIEVITVDGGAYSDAYSQDRGVSTALGAGTVFATRLQSELVEDIQRHYKNIDVHYLEMPRSLRRSGSFGTNWMLQRNITVTLDESRHNSTTLSGEEVVEVVRSLFSGDVSTLTPTAETVYEAAKSRITTSWNAVVGGVK